MIQDNNDRLQKWHARFSELDIDSPLSHPLYFKKELHIGEGAYKSLRIRKNLLTVVRFAGAAGTGGAVAGSGAVATTFFPATGIMAAVGLGAAVTPVGVIVLAAVLSGVAWTVIAKRFDDFGTRRVDEIPKFISTPLDLLAISIFDLLSPMFVKLASVDGDFDELERNTIVNYFVEDWGYDEKFVKVGIDMASESEHTFGEVISSFVEFILSNPDCNAKVVSQNVMVFLQEVAEASNGVVDREQRALLEAKSAFAELQESRVRQVGEQAVEQVGREVKKAGRNAKQVGEGVKGLFKSLTPRS
ncbi:MAG: hypothetical protein F4Y80_17385 [Caldilineaceae bacterium SB0665_bin_21]|nr:hypothetical protein [Caldilineaceae bacterium SB0665_bin_21]